MSEFRSRTSLTIVLASALALAACGKSAPPPPAAAPAPAPAAPAPAPAPATTPPVAAPAPAVVAPENAPNYVVQITSVTLANAVGPGGRVAAPSTTFTPKDTIYGVVAANAGQANASMTARWTYQGGQLVSEQVQTLKDKGANISEFHISKPDGFPAGTYALDIIVDGKSVSTTGFSVK
jgi:hypothetical protein